MSESSRGPGGGWGYAVALMALSLLFAAYATLPLSSDDGHALVGGMALSGGRLELLRFLHEPHESAVVLATTSPQEMAQALRARAPRQTLPVGALGKYVWALHAQQVRLMELPPPQESAQLWLAVLHKLGVTHVALFKDLPAASPRAEREASAAAAIAALPDKFSLMWDGRLLEVYEVAR